MASRVMPDQLSTDATLVCATMALRQGIPGPHTNLATLKPSNLVLAAVAASDGKLMLRQ